MGVSLKPITKNQYSQGIVIPDIPKPEKQKPIETQNQVTPEHQEPTKNSSQQIEIKPIESKISSIDTNKNIQTYDFEDKPYTNHHNNKLLKTAPIIDYDESLEENDIYSLSKSSNASGDMKLEKNKSFENSVEKQESKTAESPSYTTSNNKEGINFHVSGDNAKITINHYTHPLSNEGVEEELNHLDPFQVLIQETLDIDDAGNLQEVEEKIQYLNKLLDAKKTLFEAKDKYGNKG